MTRLAPRPRPEYERRMDSNTVEPRYRNGPYMVRLIPGSAMGPPIFRPRNRPGHAFARVLRRFQSETGKPGLFFRASVNGPRGARVIRDWQETADEQRSGKGS